MRRTMSQPASEKQITAAFLRRFLPRKHRCRGTNRPRDHLSSRLRHEMFGHLHGGKCDRNRHGAIMDYQMHYLPLTPAFFSILVVLFVGLIILIQLRILRYAYMRLGVGPGMALFLLFGSLIGSYFNIPVTVLPGPPVRSGEIIDFFGMRYVVPLVTAWPGTVLAVDIGGAVIPAIMSTYLVVRYQLWLKAMLATAVIAFVIHSMATPVPGVGIAVPVFVPVVATAILALILFREYAPPLAYIGGSMGTLIGADLLNLDKIGSLGAPVASIGGAATFDRIFLTGILAVLLAGIASPSRPRAAW